MVKMISQEPVQNHMEELVRNRTEKQIMEMRACQIQEDISFQLTGTRAESHGEAVLERARSQVRAPFETNC